MHSQFAAGLLTQFQWQLSLVAGVAVLIATVLLRQALLLVPTFRQAEQVNKKTYAAKMAKPYYAANQRWNRKWGAVFMAVIFGLVLPFCLTAEGRSAWRVMRDVAVILLAYDFVYYLTHRYIFHNGGPFAGPLLWMHSVHHRQHNPCRGDSSYIHPLESAIGLGLFVGTILAVSLVLGRINVLVLVITWIAFMEINLHNHDRWETDRFPFRYLNYASKLHHFHHISFTGGNFATISPLYDWMFGTLDHGTKGAAKLDDGKSDQGKAAPTRQTHRPAELT